MCSLGDVVAIECDYIEIKKVVIDSVIVVVIVRKSTVNILCVSVIEVECNRESVVGDYRISYDRLYSAWTVYVVTTTVSSITITTIGMISFCIDSNYTTFCIDTIDIDHFVLQQIQVIHSISSSINSIVLFSEIALHKVTTHKVVFNTATLIVNLVNHPN